MRTPERKRAPLDEAVHETRGSSVRVTPVDAGDGWVTLGRAIVHDRVGAWHTRAAFARACHVSERVLDDLERGRRDNYLEETLASIELTLGWAPGTCRRIVAGGSIRRQADPAMSRLRSLWPTLTEGQRQVLVTMAEHLHRRA